MNKQNITLSFKEIVEYEDEYIKAKEEYFKIMEEGNSYIVGDKNKWKREEIHNRFF